MKRVTDDPPLVLPGCVRSFGNEIHVSRDGVRVPLALARVHAIAQVALSWEGGARRVVLGITFVTNRAIARLNREHLGHEGTTDIVTFEHAPGGAWAPIVGDIYIAPAVARANALRFGLPVREEIARLVIHGVLHALGWEHPEGAEREASGMWRRQELLLARVRDEGMLP